MIRFSLFRIPVAVRPSFWLVALLLGFTPGVPLDRLVPFLGAWVGIVLVSVLAHEMGHALVARRMGASVSVTLFALGGFTSWETPGTLTPIKRVGVAAAGSIVGFALGGLVWLVLESGFVDPPSRFLAVILGLFVTVNVFWGVLNWLPIRPLDGGHIFGGLLEAAFGRTGERIADVLFPLATLAAAIVAWLNGLIFAALLAGFVLMDEFRRLSERRRPARQDPTRVPPAEPFSLFGDDESRENERED